MIYDGPLYAVVLVAFWSTAVPISQRIPLTSATSHTSLNSSDIVTPLTVQTIHYNATLPPLHHSWDELIQVVEEIVVVLKSLMKKVREKYKQTINATFTPAQNHSAVSIPPATIDKLRMLLKRANQLLLDITGITSKHRRKDVKDSKKVHECVRRVLEIARKDVSRNHAEITDKILKCLSYKPSDYNDSSWEAVKDKLTNLTHALQIATELANKKDLEGAALARVAGSKEDHSGGLNFDTKATILGCICAVVTMLSLLLALVLGFSIYKRRRLSPSVHQVHIEQDEEDEEKELAHAELDTIYETNENVDSTEEIERANAEQLSPILSPESYDRYHSVTPRFTNVARVSTQSQADIMERKSTTTTTEEESSDEDNDIGPSKRVRFSEPTRNNPSAQVSAKSRKSRRVWK